MSTASEATPHQSRELWTNRLLSQKPGLCTPCQKVDLSALFNPIANDSSQSSAEELAEARAVYLEEVSLSHAYECKDCGLCAALKECAVLGGLCKSTSVRCCIRPKVTWISQSFSQENSSRQLKASLSGQLHVWFYEMKEQKFVRPELRPELSRRLDLWFRKRTERLGFAAAEATSSDGPADLTTLFEADFLSQGEDIPGPNPSTDAEPPISDRHSASAPLDGRVLTFKSAVASWTLDIVDLPDGSFIPARVPLASRIDIDLCRKWLRECVDSHGHPETVAGVSTLLPQLPLSTCLRAINTSTGQLSALNPSEKFAALTYTWGSPSSMAQLAKLTHAARRGSDGPTSFPPTIRDAICLARDLGFKWLWVDRICIDQSNDAEKALLIPYMKDIFAAAQLTIVASSGSDANRGLPGIRITERDAEEPFVVPRKSGRDLKVLTTPISFNAMLQQSTWRTRGWCFEEHVFSRRLLYVFPSEIFFSCANGTFRESQGLNFSSDVAGSTWGDSGRTPPTIAGELHAKFHSPAANADRRITLRQFVRAVEEYTSRGLSFEEDRIKAFAGVVAVAGSAAQDTVANEPLLLHGHPLSFFGTLLTWHNEDDQIYRKPTDGRKVSPSWSWASAGTKVYFLDNGEDGSETYWFRYSVLAGFDIIGLPRGTSFPLVDNLSLASPQPILDHKPWLDDVSELPPAYQGHADASELPAYGKALRLPVLHLVTVVFKALLTPLPHGQHCMHPIGSEPETHTRVTGRWSLKPDSPEYNDIAKHAKKGEATCHSFAIVGGRYNHMYIMLLKQGDEPQTFSRAGLLSLSFYGRSPATLIMSKGGAAWKYIRLE